MTLSLKTGSTLIPLCFRCCIVSLVYCTTAWTSWTWSSLLTKNDSPTTRSLASCIGRWPYEQFAPVLCPVDGKHSSKRSHSTSGLQFVVLLFTINWTAYSAIWHQVQNESASTTALLTVSRKGLVLFYLYHAHWLLSRVCCVSVQFPLPVKLHIFISRQFDQHIIHFHTTTNTHKMCHGICTFGHRHYSLRFH